MALLLIMAVTIVIWWLCRQRRKTAPAVCVVDEPPAYSIDIPTSGKKSPENNLDKYKVSRSTAEMPAKAGGGTGASRSRRNINADNKAQQSATTQQNEHVGRSSIAKTTSQPKFNIAPLILEGAKINKIQLNDILKQHLSD
ncbi:unnamed protein product, partial [Adineta ricciae]